MGTLEWDTEVGRDLSYTREPNLAQHKTSPLQISLGKLGALWVLNILTSLEGGS